MKQRDTLKINDKGHLEIGGCDAADLAREYGTPLYVMDEAYIRKVCRAYMAELSAYPRARICYASKAFSCKAIYRIMKEEGVGADVVSGCELYTALSGGMDADGIYFHGNNKSRRELEEAVEAGVHAVVLDSFYEIGMLNEIASAAGRRQRVLVRVNPGIDAHTHHFIQTTRVDSKFGFSVADGTAEAVIRAVRELNGLDFAGLHCHIGSQIFETKPFELAVEKMTDFIANLSAAGIPVEELNLGGGYGVTYTDEDRPLEPQQYVAAVVAKLKACVAEKHIAPPVLVLEPGRSIVGEAGITLYTVGAVKDIKNVKKYVSVDGGMFENPRYALYQAKYEAVAAGRMRDKATETVTVAGKCCESGDMLVIDAHLPAMESGDLLAVLTTGAYNYSMASHYNRNAVPPVVLCRDGRSAYIVRPESYERICALDDYPDWLGRPEKEDRS